MVRPVLLLDEVLALFALVGLCAACLHVIDPDLDTELLLTILALLGPHITILFMVSELGCGRSMRTELAFDGFVRLLFVLLSICLGHDFATLTALVVAAGATDFVHTDLGDFDGSFTSRA